MSVLRYLHMDVFAATPGGGNHLGVVIGADDWSTEEMQRFARWTALVETTFLLPPTEPNASYRVRIFMPHKEIPFAGHPSIGSAHAVLACGVAQPRDGVLWQECGAGVLPIRVEGHDARNLRQMERAARRARGRWPLAEVELHGALHDAAAAAGDTGRAARAAFAAHRAADRSAVVLPITLATLRHPLSGREREVAELVSRGKSNRQIAAAAGVSVRTVDNQVQSIYRKLGLDGRDALRELCEG